MTHDVWLQGEVGAWCLNVSFLIVDWLLFQAMREGRRALVLAVEALR